MLRQRGLEWSQRFVETCGLAERAVRDLKKQLATFETEKRAARFRARRTFVSRATAAALAVKTAQREEQMANLAARVAGRKLQMQPANLHSAAARALEGGEEETNKNYWCAHSVTRDATPEWGVAHVFCPECGSGFARRFETLERTVQQAKGGGSKLLCSTRFGGCGEEPLLHKEDLGVPIMVTGRKERTVPEWEVVFRMRV